MSKYLFITYITLSSLLGVTMGYINGYVNGWDIGMQTGEASILMQNAGKCFRHLDKERQK